MTSKCTSNKNWRKNNPIKWNEQKNRYYRKYQILDKCNSKYTESEIKLILNHDISDVELGKILNRSVMAIQVKRSKLKNGVK